MQPDAQGFEAEVRAAGEELFSRASSSPPRLYSGVTGNLLERCMRDDQLRDALFQFVDVLPQLAGRRDIAEHFSAYVKHVPLAGWHGRLLGLITRPYLAGGVRLFVEHLAGSFLAKETPAGIQRAIRELARIPALTTVDAVGEAVLSEAEAEAYLQRNLRVLDAFRSVATPHLSIKLTALTAHCDPLDYRGTRERIFARIAPLMSAVAECGATLSVDMEQYELKPMLLGLFGDLLEAFPDPRWQPAIALQAYLPDTANDIGTVLDLAQRHGRRLGIRLVKGAYWDQEKAWAAQRGWPQPTFANKPDTDANYERLTRRLLESCDTLHPAIASHNLRSQAVALATARRLGLNSTQWEAQMLYGMAEPLRDAVVASGTQLRVYVPTGDLVIGIAYLMRRLIENTTSTSILRQAYIDGADLDAILAPPQRVFTGAGEWHPGSGGFANLPLLDFSREHVQKKFRDALAGVRAALPHFHVMEGSPAGRPHHECRNPAQPDELLGQVELAQVADVDATVMQARLGFAVWRDTPVAERCRILRLAADMIEAEREHLAALEVLEEAKPWREADGDIAEAVDFLRYYCREMECLDGWHTTDPHVLPGESNLTSYGPRGVAVVIAPWNFPLAILAGMTSAALVTGNAVIMKPALPSLLVAHELLRILRMAGVSHDAIQWLPGDAEVGEALVAHHAVHVVAFTGSRQVGLKILQAAHTPAPGQHHVKQVVCEMGGKNAIVVDADADLDEAVSGILASAFGYSGQKCSACSRVIAVGDVHDKLLERLTAAADALLWGPPEDPAYAQGPLISEAAQRKALGYIEIGRQEGRLVWQGRVPLSGGWYVPPTIFAGIEPQHRLAREEVFGPVVAVLRAPDFESALEMALDSDYALTGGVYSRFPAHLELATKNYHVGNLYLNRKITGARVALQPFGGVGLSGTGIQAGGGDYLRQFLWSRVVTVNTMRHGFIPADAGG